MLCTPPKGGPVGFDGLQLGGQVFVPVVVIAQDFEHVEGCAVQNQAGHFQAFLFVQITTRLLHLHLARQKVFLGHERTGVMLVKIEKVNRYMVLAQKVVKRGIGIKGTKDKELGGGFDRNKTRLAFLPGFVARREPQGVVLPLQTTGIE